MPTSQLPRPTTPHKIFQPAESAVFADAFLKMVFAWGSKAKNNQSKTNMGIPHYYNLILKFSNIM